MALKWKKLGKTVWHGEDGSYRYTINAKPFPLTGDIRYYVTQGGIASSGHFASCSNFDRAKKIAQEAATEWENKVLALPNFIEP